MCLERVLLNIGNPHVDSHQLSTDKSFCPKIPLTRTSSINLSNSSIVTFQFILSKISRVSATAHFHIFLSNAPSNEMRKDATELQSIILLVANEVEPGLKLSMFCCCNRPRCTLEVTKASNLFCLFQSSPDLFAIGSVDCYYHLLLYYRRLILPHFNQAPFFLNRNLMRHLLRCYSIYHPNSLLKYVVTATIPAEQ